MELSPRLSTLTNLHYSTMSLLHRLLHWGLFITIFLQGCASESDKNGTSEISQRINVIESLIDSCNCLIATNNSFGSGNSIQDNSFIIPYLSSIYSIDSTDLYYNEDNILVIKDRINIALKDKSAKFVDLLDSLTANFLNENRQIIAFDSNTTRIHLSISDLQPDSINNSIRKSLPSFDLLIWDESIFDYSGALPAALNGSKTVSTNWHIKALNLDKAWAVTQGTLSTTIAIIDDGFDRFHPSFQDVVIQQPYNLQNRDTIVYATHLQTHGTHVSGLIFGSHNSNQNSKGVSPACTFLPIQLMGRTGLITSSMVIEGILYALRNNADIINLSLGTQFHPSISHLSVEEQRKLIATSAKDAAYFWDELFMTAVEDKAVIVVAAGNDSIIVGLDPFTRSDHCIVVGAIDSFGNIASFSNFGDSSMVFAPGVDVYSLLPNNTFGFESGTSMASPMIAGLIGLMKSVNPDLGIYEIKQLLKHSSQRNKFTQHQMPDAAIAIALAKFNQYLP